MSTAPTVAAGMRARCWRRWDRTAGCWPSTRIRRPPQRARAEFAGDARVSVHHGSFARLGEFVDAHGLRGQIAGVLLDLGMSSIQLDDAGRGFSFMRAGPLDMRMDTSREPTAAQWLQDADEAQIEQVLREFGEERYARRIAAAVVARRAQAPIATTDDLVDVVRGAMPRREQHKHFATRTFQALRMVVNHELEDLAAGLEQALSVLAPGGRLVVLSFHSLEDRPVKQFMRLHAGRFEGAHEPPVAAPGAGAQEGRRGRTGRQSARAQRHPARGRAPARRRCRRMIERIGHLLLAALLLVCFASALGVVHIKHRERRLVTRTERAARGARPPGQRVEPPAAGRGHA